MPVDGYRHILHARHLLERPVIQLFQRLKFRLGRLAAVREITDKFLKIQVPDIFIIRGKEVTEGLDIQVHNVTALIPNRRVHNGVVGGQLLLRQGAPGAVLPCQRDLHHGLKGFPAAAPVGLVGYWNEVLI